MSYEKKYLPENSDVKEEWNEREDRVDYAFDALDMYLLNKFYPVGTLYESTESANPSTFMGGTWEEYGKGRVTVAVDTSQTIFNSSSKIGGSNTHKLTVEEMPAHRHDFRQGSGTDTGINDAYKNLWTYGDGREGSTAGTLHTDNIQGVQLTGGGASHNILQPYIVVYRFRRTA